MISISHIIPVQEKNACAPAALAFVTGQPFNKVNEWLIRNGFRRYGKGTKVTNWLYKFGFVPILFKLDEMTVSEFIKNYSDPDTWFVLMDRHVAIIRKGEVYDTRDSSGCIVKHAWCRVNDNLPIDL